MVSITPLRLGNKEITFERPLVMGILNVTEDSFYGGCRSTAPGAIHARVVEIIEQGADLIDVGACSSRPGSVPVPEDVEKERINETLDIIHAVDTQIPISVDTYRAEVAKLAIEKHQVDIINDISGGEMDENMLPLIAETNVGYVVTHMQGTPTTMQQNPEYDDVMDDLLQFFAQKVMALKKMGADNIILDPGFGFGKTLAHNYTILKNLDAFTEFGHPILAGISRKRMITQLLDVATEDALYGTQAADVLALVNGATILRVHDVLPAVHAVRVFQAYREQPEW